MQHSISRFIFVSFCFPVNRKMKRNNFFLSTFQSFSFTYFIISSDNALQNWREHLNIISFASMNKCTVTAKTALFYIIKVLIGERKTSF